MERRIHVIKDYQKERALDFVKGVFTDSEDLEAGELVKNLIKEIRRKKFYIPDLELVMTNEEDELIGYAMFSRFHLEGRYEDELLILNPVAVKTSLQRQHVSKDLIEYGLAKAKKMGYKVCIVEGNPQNYRARGFVTSADYGVFSSEKVGLPAPECLMIQELVEGALAHIHGYLDYSFYQTLD